MLINYRESPNWNERPSSQVSVLVLHYTGMLSADAAISRLCDENAQVSAHYVVDEDGAVTCLVTPERRAWHAGVSSWRGRENVNDVSIGIEMVNRGHEFGYQEFPQVQLEAVVSLSQELLVKYPLIVPRNVVAHSDIALLRKQDPGELFDWEYLARHGVGVVVRESVPEGCPVYSAHQATMALQRYGYQVDVVDVWDAQALAVAIAFQRHFRRSDISGVWDAECTFILDKLLEMA